ncbi:MAG: FAD-dependent monooxygenase, partial [Halioglobus sp.]|nr:FAD-dependent monooxygenase [Halioglobus sp.]
ALLLVADGANSRLCRCLGVELTEKLYDQHAVVANVATSLPHGGCAFERFTDEGPLAMLPLPAAAGAEHRCALVWTLPPERAASMRDCSEQAFLAQLQRAFGYRLGRLRAVSARHSYPLALTRAREQVRQGIVVMGNAAHALHPVAGQGYNLALRDIAGLATVLAQGLQAGDALGELSSLRRYQNHQHADQARTIGFSDRVPELFMHADPLLGVGRDIALAGLDLLPAAKREFVRHAAGVAALKEHPYG